MKSRCVRCLLSTGAINSLDELEELAILAVRALDALLDYQDYPIPAAKRGAMGRRTLGIGVINFAYYGEARCALLRRQRQQPDA